MFPPEIADRATSLSLARGGALSRDEVLARVLDALYAAHATWQTGGFAAFRREFSRYDLLAGKTVSIRQTDDDPAPVTGLCGGVQEDGTLLVGGAAIHAGEAHVLSVG